MIDWIMVSIGVLVVSVGVLSYLLGYRTGSIKAKYILDDPAVCKTYQKSQQKCF